MCIRDRDTSLADFISDDKMPEQYRNAEQGIIHEELLGVLETLSKREMCIRDRSCIVQVYGVRHARASRKA